MSCSRFLRMALMALACVAFMPAAASAQSTIAGQVVDDTGGALPGVTVEGCSPALIEACRLQVTDGAGRYTFVDLRPGTYSVTFTLPGFATLIRDELPLVADFTMDLDVELPLSGIQETVTVTGESAVVDVQQTAQTQRLDREIMNNVPSGRTIQAMAQLVPGIAMSDPDVGGHRTAGNQIYMTAHGSDQVETTFEIDGQIINGVGSDGRRMHYMNDSANEEVTYQTSGIGADTSRGGVRVNMIGRSGGNTFSGALLAEGMDADAFGGKMLSDNLTDELKARGVTRTSGIERINDINGYVSGPIVQDRLWFFAGTRSSNVDLVAPNVVYNNPIAGAGLADFYGNSALGGVTPDESRAGVQEQTQKNLTGRLTYQANSSNRLSFHYDQMWRTQPHLGTNSGVRIEDASAYWESALDNAYVAKWTSTLSDRALLEVGFSGMNQHLFQPHQTESNFITDILPNGGILQSRPANMETCFVTPCFSGASNQGANGGAVDPWYQVVRREDLTRRTAWGASAQRGGEYPERLASSAALSYVTGTHQLKFGVQWSSGTFRVPNDRNGDMEMHYRNGVPDRVEVSNTPIELNNKFDYDIGIYGQDTWTRDRLSLSLGLRLEMFQASTVGTSSPAGRFVPARDFPDVTPINAWVDYAPRLGFVYDVLGDASTAIKFSVGKYMRPYTTALVDDFNLMGTQGGPRAGLRDNRDWDDCTYLPASSTCSGLDPYGTNGDNIAQDWEIGPPNRDFVTTRATDTAEPDLQRPGNWLMNVGIEREVTTGVRINVNYYHRQWFDELLINNRALTLSDWTSFTVPNPLGSAVAGVCCPDVDDFSGFNDTITIYNRNANTRGQRDVLRTNSSGSDRGNTYNGFELGWNARIPGGGAVFGAYNLEKRVVKECDSPSNPNTFRFCDDSEGGLPWTHLAKVAANYPLPYGVQLSGVVQSYPGSFIQYTWSPPRGVFSAAGLSRTESVNINLNDFGSVSQPRKTQVDMSIGKYFDLPRGARWKVSFDIYNLFNIDNIEDQRSGTSDSPGARFGRTLGVGRGVSETWIGRLWKVGTRFEF